jgi:hypothetical protein
MQSIDPTVIHDKQTTKSIFCQLLQTTCSPLQHIVEEWYLGYHGETVQLDSLIVANKVYKRNKNLKTVSKLTVSSTNPEIMALKAHVDHYAKTTASIFNTIVNKFNKNHTLTQTSQCPPWFHHPPSDPNQTHEHHGRTWPWCNKCNTSRSGRWV